MEEVLRQLNARQMRGLIRYCYKYNKPLNLATVTYWVEMRADAYRRKR